MAAMRRVAYHAVAWRPWLCRGFLVGGAARETTDGAEVSGVVRMPDVCSPAVSPAVVYLTPAEPA